MMRQGRWREEGALLAITAARPSVRPSACLLSSRLESESLAGGGGGGGGDWSNFEGAATDNPAFTFLAHFSCSEALGEEECCCACGGDGPAHWISSVFGSRFPDITRSLHTLSRRGGVEKTA